MKAFPSYSEQKQIEIPQEFRTKSYIEFTSIWFSKAFSLEQKDYILSHYSDIRFFPVSLSVQSKDLLISHAYRNPQEWRTKEFPELQINCGEFQA